MNNKQDVKYFSMHCKECEDKGQYPLVQLHIDFKKKYYFFICYGCGVTESFDEENRRITREGGGQTGNTGNMPSSLN